MLVKNAVEYQSMLWLNNWRTERNRYLEPYLL